MDFTAIIFHSRRTSRFPRSVCQNRIEREKKKEGTRKSNVVRTNLASLSRPFDDVAERGDHLLLHLKKPLFDLQKNKAMHRSSFYVVRKGEIFKLFEESSAL